MPRKIDSIQSFELQFDVQLLPRSNESQVVCVQSNFLLSFRARQLLLSGGNIWVVHFSSNYAISYYIQILYKKHFSAFRLHTSLPNNSPKISTRLYFRRKKCVEKEKKFSSKNCRSRLHFVVATQVEVLLLLQYRFDWKGWGGGECSRGAHAV